MKRSPAGFTILELLVTVTVISVLAAIAYQLHGDLRERALGVQCVSNLRTLGSAMMLFAQEHQGQLPTTTEAPYYPGPVFGTVAPKWGPTWAEYLVATYLNRNKTFLKCPSRPKEWSPAGYVGNYPDYGMNERLTDHQSGYRYGKRLNAISRPNQTILLADAARYSSGAAVGGFYRIYGPEDLHPRHSGSRVNVLFVDLHIENHLLNRSQVPKADEPLGINSFLP